MPLDQKRFRRVEETKEKYHELIFALPGLMMVAWDDERIAIDVKPQYLELARQFVSSSLDGIPVVFRPRNNPPMFVSCGD